MGTITERIMQLNIQVSSPDQTVTGRLTMRAGMSIELAPDIRQWHDEDSLGAQIEATLRGLVAGQRRAGHMLRGRHEPDPSEEPRTPAAKRDVMLREAIAEQLDVSAESRDGNVLIRQAGEDDFLVVIVRGSLGRISTEALTAEVNSALFKVRRDFGRQARRLNEQFYSSRSAGART